MLSEQSTQIAVLKKKYSQVFSAGLGTILHFKARLTVKPEAKPVFFFQTKIYSICNQRDSGSITQSSRS